jgi:ribosomal protein S18 acetylase RimI-like enzyme
MKYTIVPIAEEHSEGYCAALDNVARERKYLAWLEGPSLAMSRAFVLNNIEEAFPHFVALDGNTVIGWCDIVPYNNRPVFAHCGALGIGVLSSYRGQGIGKKLMFAALEKAKLIGLTRVELTVRENNKSAIALYEKFGFIVEGLKRKGLRIEEHYENIICMGLLF